MEATLITRNPGTDAQGNLTTSDLTLDLVLAGALHPLHRLARFLCTPTDASDVRRQGRASVPGRQ